MHAKSRLSNTYAYMIGHAGLQLLTVAKLSHTSIMSLYYTGWHYKSWAAMLHTFVVTSSSEVIHKIFKLPAALYTALAR